MKKIALFLLLLMGGLIIYSQLGKPRTYNFIFPKAILEENIQNNGGLESAVEEVLKESEGRYGIYIKNLKTGDVYAKNGHEIFEPASLYKVWVMGTVFEKIKEGSIKENDKLTADIPVLNKKFNISSEDAEFKEGVINFSIKSAIEQMITISHNYAALALTEKVGSREVKEFMKRYGLVISKFGPPLKTTALELGMFFEKLYRGEVIDQQYSQKMVDLLVRQKRNDRIPKYLPEGTLIAHKTGELPNIRNDGGIVYSPNGDFVIIILSETGDVTFASDTIAKISEASYKYFNR